jgi:hypothetical protein
VIPLFEWAKTFLALNPAAAVIGMSLFSYVGLYVSHSVFYCYRLCFFRSSFFFTFVLASIYEFEPE